MRQAIGLVLPVWLSLACATSAIHQRSWLEARTAHFTIWSCQREARVRELALELELFRAVVEFVIGEPVPTSPVPVHVYAFDTSYTYRPFAVEGAAGYFEPSLRDSTIVLAARSATGVDATQVIQHEYVHFLLDSHADFVYPRWYHEGFAEFLGSVRARRDRIVIGAVPRGRVPSFDTWMPTEKLLGLEGGMRVDPYALYAESWALVHYLNFGREEPGEESTRRQLTRYFRAREKGRPVAEAVEEAFGMSLEHLDSELGRYVRHGRYRSYRVDADGFTPAEPPSLRPLPADEVATVLGELSLKRGRYAQAAGYFREARRLHPGSTAARRGLAAAHAGLGDPAAAEAEYRAALADAPGDALAHLDLANFLHERAAEAVAPAERSRLIADARHHYVASWKLDDGIPETYARYGKTFLLEGEDPARGLETLRHAYALLPSSMEIRLDLARLHLAQGNPREAHRIALAAAAIAHDEETEQVIQEILARTAGAPGPAGRAAPGAPG